MVRLNSLTIDAGSVHTNRGGTASRIRASVLLAGPLLARFGHVELPPPGGDVIGGVAWTRISRFRGAGLQ